MEPSKIAVDLFTADSSGRMKQFRIIKQSSPKTPHLSKSPHWVRTDLIEDYGLISKNSEIKGLKITNDRRNLVTGGADGQMIKWDIKTRMPSKNFGRICKSFIMCIEITPDGETIFVGEANGDL
jgi:WD40 repeat protein